MRQQIGLHITDRQHRLHISYPRFTRAYYLKRNEQAAHMWENMANLKTTAVFDDDVSFPGPSSFLIPKATWYQRDLIF